MLLSSDVLILNRSYRSLVFDCVFLSCMVTYLITECVSQFLFVLCSSNGDLKMFEPSITV